MESETTTASKKEEIFVFFLVLGVVLPLLSVAFIGGYGFIVWMSQLLFGPLGH